MTTQDQETLPPSALDREVESFEACIRSLGEARARLEALLSLLEGQS